MEDFSDKCTTEVKVIDFGCIPVDTTMQKYVTVENTSDNCLSYRITNIYILNNVDHVFNVSITSSPVQPGECASTKIVFQPNVVGQSFTDYYLVDDTAGNTYRLTVTGKCYGPQVYLDKRKLFFRVCKNVTEQRKEVIYLVNSSPMDTTYQWYIPVCGQGYFQISSGSCGLIRGFETIPITILFIGTALGIYTAELVCLVLNQNPLFINLHGTIVLSGNNPMIKSKDHVFEKKYISPYIHLMENSLSRLPHIPSASAFERYIDFGTGSVDDVTRNISQTICVTNHEQEEGFIQWMPDPEGIFLIDPIEATIPPNESRLFTVRFRPKINNELYGYLVCGDFQYEYIPSEANTVSKLKHTWFRIPCTGNTWLPCTEWISEWNCPTEVVLPPTVPARTTFTNFMLSNKFEMPMHFKFEAPYGTNFAVLPICGIVQGRGWQLISVALEPISFGDYCEAWDLIINKFQKSRISFVGNAELSQVEVMSHGNYPAAHAMLEFQPTITGCTNYVTSYLHNLTRMEIHMRVLNYVPWLGADFRGSMVLPPKEIMHYHWWFFPETPDKVYETTITLSCVCLIEGRPVGEPSEIYIHLAGFSELPDLRLLSKRTNIHDIVVGESSTFSLTLYNYGSCLFTSKLYHVITGDGDDYSGDRFEMDSTVNTLKPSNHCSVKMTVTPDGAGPRQIEIRFTVLFRTEYDEIAEIQPIKKRIGIVWYDGIYPIIKVKRTLSVRCPVIMSNHDVWSITNVQELNKAFANCRPNKPLSVNLYAPNLCMHAYKTSNVELIFVMGCIYSVPVPWNLRREKICDCELVEVQVGTSLYEMRHTCEHRTYVELYPQSGIVSPKTPNLLHLKFNYAAEGLNTLCYIMTMPNQRIINIYINIYASLNTKSILAPLRRPIGNEKYLTVLDCGRVPINNLDPVVRIIWLYNPSDVFTTWRLLRGNTAVKGSTIQCMLYFAEIPPLGKLAIPVAFLPTEMIDYEVLLVCSFGSDNAKILVKGQGGLPNCIETRLDIPFYTERVIREAYRKEVVYLSVEHLTIPPMSTHSLSRDLICICNDTDHMMRFIWLPERIANIVNIVMTPCWGVIQPKTAEWITMTVYTLQAPATFTITVSCEILDLTQRKAYQRNEYLKRNKIEQSYEEFIITEEGMINPDIKDLPPSISDVKKPEPSYLTISVSISSKGQRDGCTRFLLRQLWDQTPPYNLLCTDLTQLSYEKSPTSNNLTTVDILRILDGILWDALHNKMFRNQLKFYAKEEIPTCSQLIKEIESGKMARLSRRVTSGICDAIVNKAMFHVYSLKPKHNTPHILEAE